jgi:hypothetical protein
MLRRRGLLDLASNKTSSKKEKAQQEVSESLLAHIEPKSSSACLLLPLRVAQAAQ